MARKKKEVQAEEVEGQEVEKEAEVSEVKGITIPRRNYKVATITLVGDTPLIVNKFSSKAKQEMFDKQTKKAKTARAAKDPEQCFRDSLYILSQSKGGEIVYGIPAGGLKKCAVSACRFVNGVKMTHAKGAFQVLADALTNLVPINGSEPEMREDIVRIGNFGNKVADLRYRAMFREWKVKFAVKYDADLISAEQLANLYDVAGFSVGQCEWRTEKDGNFGMFHVERG